MAANKRNNSPNLDFSNWLKDVQIARIPPKCLDPKTDCSKISTSEGERQKAITEAIKTANAICKIAKAIRKAGNQK